MNFQKICRICVIESSGMTSIFASCNFSADNREISKVITDCASVQIGKLDGFSERICRSCLDHLSQAYSFKKLCEDSDYKFRNNLIASKEMEMKTEFCEEDTVIIYENHINETSKFTRVKEECKAKITIKNKSENDSTLPSAATKNNLEQFDLKCIQNYESGTSNKSLMFDTKLPEEAKLNTNKVTRKIIRTKLPAGRKLNTNYNEEFTQKVTDTKLLAEKVEKQFKCEVCDKQFTSKRNLVAHDRLHTGEKPFKCDVCQKTFAQSSTLAKHIKSHTGEKLHKCDACPKQFIDRSSLTIHSRLHSGEKPYVCEICNKQFTSNGNLARHIPSHNPERRYNCELCDKQFTYKNNLAVHMRLHTGEMPFKCEFCDKQFAHKNSLVTHVRLHTGERPYKCDFCNKSFIHRNSLAMHTRLHTGEKPYKCDVCEETFTQGIHLARHRKNRHGVKVL